MATGRWLAPVRAVVDFALPPRCPACGVIVSEPLRLCLDCWGRLDFLAPDAGCAGCGVPFDTPRPPDSLCGACLAEPPRHDGIRAVVAYGDVAQAIAIKFKHGRRIGLARMIAALGHRLVPPEEDWLLAPVPLHRWRLWSRGFNQSALIAQALRRSTGHQVAVDLLHRKRATPMMRGMGRVARRRLLAGAIELGAGWDRAAIEGRAVLLIDDVHTSGATANACAAVLKRAGARRVVMLCWARVLLDRAEQDAAAPGVGGAGVAT